MELVPAEELARTCQWLRGLEPFLHENSQPTNNSVAAHDGMSRDVVDRGYDALSLEAMAMQNGGATARQVVEGLRAERLVHVDATHWEWRKGALLGRGAFGEVYRTNHKGASYAVKCIQVEGKRDSVGRLVSEISNLSTYQHPHVVKLHKCQLSCDEDIADDDENAGLRVELFMELCQFAVGDDSGNRGVCSSLEDLKKFRGGRLGVVEVRRFTKQVLQGLQYLHANGVLHRDIKPGNILLSDHGFAKVGDFGCSKVLGCATLQRGGKQQTMTGTLVFMAPEAFGRRARAGCEAARPTYGLPVDVWSLGCTVLSLLGYHPWVGFKDMDKLMLLVEDTDGFPNGAPDRSVIPASLHAFFERCFERDPSKRATCDELLQTEWITCDEDLLEDLPVHAVSPS